MISSFVVEAENALSPDVSRRSLVNALLELAGDYVGREEAAMRRAESLVGAGLSGRDALHVAAAEYAGADFLVTCDDKLIKRARRIGSSVKVASPLELLEGEWI